MPTPSNTSTSPFSTIKKQTLKYSEIFRYSKKKGGQFLFFAITSSSKQKHLIRPLADKALKSKLTYFR